MNNSEFILYKTQIADDFQDVVMDLLSKYYIWSKDVSKYENKVKVAAIIIEYFIDELVLTDTASFDYNLLDYETTIKLSETLNMILGTTYKPTFLTDVDNYKSIREGGY